MKKSLVTQGFILTLAFVVTLVHLSVASSIRRSAYGEPCNKTSRCDSRAWLGCFDGVCDCIKQDEMIYEENISKCVTKSGERCTFSLDDDVEDSNSIIEVTSCVSNSACSWDGICVCGDKFYENENGTCTSALGHLQPCNSTPQCSQYQALECQDGLCRCNISSTIYSSSESDLYSGSYEMEEPQCVGLHGKACINSRCTEGASCSSGNSCVCADTMFPDLGMCVPKRKPLQSCTATNQCEQSPGQTVVCLYGKCNCDPRLSIHSTAQETIKESDTQGYPYNYNYNTGGYGNSQDKNAIFNGFEGALITQCVGIANSPCIDRLCTTNAFCSYPIHENDPGQEGICKCQLEFFQSKRGTCAAGFESSCSVTSDCIDNLVCRNSRCLCPYRTQVFEPSSKSCISEVGGPCADNSFCGGNAKCDFSKGTGHCACKRGYVENLGGKCEAGFDTNCSSATVCDSVASLECISKKCKCPIFAEYHAKLRKCVGLAGAKCDMEKNNESECTQNSQCKNGTFAMLPGTCTCNPGFVEFPDYTCHAGIFINVTSDASFELFQD